MDQRILTALAVSSLAGLATGGGGAIVALSRARPTKLMAGGLGLSGGVMVYVSFVELFPDSLARMGHVVGPSTSRAWATLAFFAGIALIALIDRLVPDWENPHVASAGVRGEPGPAQAAPAAPPAVPPAELARMGLLTALAVTIHNFPEGFATFVSSYHDLRLGLPVAVAVAIHNLPEGIAVAVPVLLATNSPRRAFVWALVSGLAEPAGALAGWLALDAILDEVLVGVALAAVAGIMVFISLDQLIPNSRRYDAGHVPVYGLVAGMAITAITLVILRV